MSSLQTADRWRLTHSVLYWFTDECKLVDLLRVGHRGGALKFAAMILSARRRTVKQARTLRDRVEQAMVVNDGACS